MELKLFMLMLGCVPPGRHVEQHDVFFAIGESLTQLVPEIKAFGPNPNVSTLMHGAQLPLLKATK